MATNKNTKPAPKSNVKSAKTEEKAPRIVRKATDTPEAIFNYCIEQQEKLGGVPKSAVAEHFNISPTSLVMLIMEYCARNGVVPPRFQQKGSAMPGTVKVRKQGKNNAPVLSIGPSYLRSIGIETSETGALFAIEVNTEERSFIVRFVEETGEEAGDEDDDN